MNGVSVGAINGARAAFNFHDSGSSPEGQAPYKSNTDELRRQPLSNSPTPLTGLPADRVTPSEYGQTSQQQFHARDDEPVAGRSKPKSTSEITGRQTLLGKQFSNGSPRHTEVEDIPENMYRPEKYDAEGWIHREKLAKIENEELQAAGINLAKARTRSRDALRTASRDRLRTDFASSEGLVREDKMRKVSSPMPVQRDDDEDMADKENWDFRSPEEIAAEQAITPSYITPVSRKSGSKIPVLSPNMQPVSPESPDRGISLQHRKRTMSGSISNDDGLVSQKMRTTSPNWSDDVTDSIPATTEKANSPSKMKQNSVSNGSASFSTAKSSVPRKVSATKQPPTLPNGRPRTRGNDSERPRTAVNPPEGDPPWLADMYKPDPRLPPDQQIIPTLAKKQRQMQWEEEGMVPKTYDREFTALAVHEHEVGEMSVPQPVEPEIPIERPDDTEAWPLKPLPSVPTPKDMVPKPTISNTTVAPTGGYSTMPKVSSPHMSMASPKIGTPSATNVAPPNVSSPVIRQTSGSQQQQAQKTQPRPQIDDDDEKVQKKGCGCCIVM